jgi:hypothetical protein
MALARSLGYAWSFTGRTPLLRVWLLLSGLLGFALASVLWLFVGSVPAHHQPAQRYQLISHSGRRVTRLDTATGEMKTFEWSYDKRRLVELQPKE